MFQLNSKMHPTKTIGGHQLSHKEDLVDEVSLKNHLDPSPSIKSSNHFGQVCPWPLMTQYCYKFPYRLNPFSDICLHTP